MKSNLDYVRKMCNGKKTWFCNQTKSQEYAIVLNISSLPMRLLQDQLEKGSLATCTNNNSNEKTHLQHKTSKQTDKTGI